MVLLLLMVALLHGATAVDVNYVNLDNSAV
jgi:hypothetical protein